jgi:membrane associated rhomboid family serine protease
MPIGLSAPPATRRPYATAALVLLLVAVFAWTLLLRRATPALFCSDLTESAQALRSSADTLQGFTCRWGAVPDQLHRGRDLLTLLTSVFVHTGWLHLLVNLAFLAAFAPRVEEDLGHAGLLLLFLGSATVAGVVHVLLVPDQTDPSIGASGGVAGVLGAHLLLAPRAQVRVLVAVVPVRLPTWFVIGMWAGVQLVYTVVALQRAQHPGGVSYDVHVVGFVTGLTAVLLALHWRPGLRRWRPARPSSTASSASAPAPSPGASGEPPGPRSVSGEPPIR